MSQRASGLLLMLIGCQYVILGPWYVGIVILAVSVWQWRRLGWRWLIIGAVLGVASGTIEQIRTNDPARPANIIMVQPTSWRAGSAGYYSYSGRDVNGVYVTGGGTVSDNTARQIDNARTPIAVSWSGAPERIAGPRNLFEFDYRRYAWEQFHQAFRIPTQELRVVVQPVRTLSDHLYSLRNRLLMRMDRLPAKMNTYARALILGIMDGEMVNMRDVFGRLGIVHLFSVSGLHIFALVAMLYWFSDRVRIPCEWVDWALLFGLPLLLVIIPPGAGIVRAVWMRFLQIINDRWSWRLSTLDIFSVVLAGNLMVQPRVLGTLGGQLTYLLTFFLIVQPVKGRLRSALAMAVVSMPPLLSAMFGVHPLTFVFNCLLMPVFERVLMPVLILACFWPTCPLWPVCAKLLTAFETLLVTLGRLPGYWQFGALPGLACLLLLLLTLRAITNRRWWTPTLCLLACYLYVNVHPQWRVVILDVGQGDSILIEAPWKQATVLIDTGGRAFGQTSSPPARRVTLNYLAARGISHLDALILTHPDADHVGDAPIITSGIKVRRIITTPMASKDALVQRARAHGMPPIIPVMGGAQLQVGPLRMLVAAPQKVATDTNSNSVVLYGKIGDSNWLLTGDAGRQVETEQLQPQHLAVDFLKVGHHGSKTASAPNFIASIHPQVGFISAGVNNRYGHPNKETLATFNKLKVPLLVTSQRGMIWVDADKQRHTVHTFLAR